MGEEQRLEGNHVILTILRKLPLFKAFEEEDLLRLHAEGVARVMRYREGETVIERGNYEKTFYVLLAGRARIVKDGRQVAKLDAPGAVFGEMSFILGRARNAEVVAATDAVCLVADMGVVDFFPDDKRERYLTAFYRLLAPIVASRLGSANARKAEILERIREERRMARELVRESRERVAAMKAELAALEASDDEEILKAVLARKY